jgi:ankyrin repeat protein
MTPNSPIGNNNDLIQRNARNHMGTESEPQPPPPDAVPGAKARAPAAPAPKGIADMNPNDALFDAINRGDIGAARDALNRGADLHAQNILGMTPMELSVDLGRNDISFLLLSMRDADTGGGAPKATPSATQLALEKAAAGPRPRATRPAKPITVANKPVATPKLFANDGGAPLPSAGFLGFDPRSSTN